MSLIMQLQICGGKFVGTTAINFIVAKALNRYNDSTFMAALSECDRAAMSELVEDFFYSGFDEKEPGKQLYIKIYFQNTIEICDRWSWRVTEQIL